MKGKVWTNRMVYQHSLTSGTRICGCMAHDGSDIDWELDRESGKKYQELVFDKRMPIIPKAAVYIKTVMTASSDLF